MATFGKTKTNAYRKRATERIEDAEQASEVVHGRLQSERARDPDMRTLITPAHDGTTILHGVEDGRYRMGGGPGHNC